MFFNTYIFSLLWGIFLGLPIFTLFGIFLFWYRLPIYKPKLKPPIIHITEEPPTYEFHNNTQTEVEEVLLESPNTDSHSVSSWISVSPSDHIHDTRSLQQGWLRVTNTPNPSDEPTVFEKAHHMMFQSWKGLSIPFLAPGTSSESDSQRQGSQESLSTSKEDNSNSYNEGGKIHAPGSLINPRVSRLIDENITELGNSGAGEEFINQSNFDDRGYDYRVSESSNPKRLSTISELSDDKFPSSNSLHSSINVSNSDQDLPKSSGRKPNDHRKCISERKFLRGWYYSVIQDTKLYLYQDETCSELNMIIDLAHYDVTIYPYNLLEYELFFPQYPFLLAGHAAQDGTLPPTPTSHTSVSSTNRSEWNPNYYIFAETSVEKEDWYHIFVKKCRHTFCCASSLLSALDIPPLPLDPENPNQPPPGVRVTSARLIYDKYELLKENVLRSYKCSTKEPDENTEDQRDSDPSNDHSSEMEGEKDTQCGIEVFNAILGMMFLSMIQSEHLLMSLQLFLFRLLARWLPFFISVDLVDFDLGDQVPIFAELPKLTTFDRMGELALEVPLKYKAEFYFSFQIKLFHNPEPPPNYKQYTVVSPDGEEYVVEEKHEDLYLTFRWPRWMQTTFNLDFRFGLHPMADEDPAFATTAHLRIFPPPTHRFWVGLSDLPPLDKIWAHIVINGRLFEIPRSLIQDLLSFSQDNVQLPNMKDITFFPSEWMIPTINPPPSWSDPLPRLMETLAKGKGKRDRKNSMPSSSNNPGSGSPTLTPAPRPKSGFVHSIKKRFSSTLDIIPQTNNIFKVGTPDRGVSSMSTSLRTTHLTPSDESSHLQFADAIPDLSALILPVMPISQIQPISTLVHFDLQPPNAGDVGDLETTSPIATSKILLRLTQLENGLSAASPLPQPRPLSPPNSHLKLPVMLRNRRGWHPITQSRESYHENIKSRSAPVSPSRSEFEKPLPALLNRLSIVNVMSEDKIIDF